MGHVSGEQAQNSLVLLFFKRHAPFCFSHHNGLWDSNAIGADAAIWRSEPYHHLTNQLILLALLCPTVRIPVFLVVQAYICREVRVAD